jgi:uncharacterized paraquat-inducible protein A
MPIIVCPSCGISFPLSVGRSRHETPCPRCGKTAPEKTAPSRWPTRLWRLAVGSLLALALAGAVAGAAWALEWLFGE